MTVLLKGVLTAASGAKDPSSSKGHKQVCYWIPVVLVPILILNSCFLFSALYPFTAASNPFLNFTAERIPDENVKLADPQRKILNSTTQDENVNLADPLRKIPNSTTQGTTCDLFRGQWVHDPSPPIYTNGTCKYIQPFQDCMTNGKPDLGYLNWRWKPHECELPRFDPAQFLRIMRGKKLVFLGDSLARNHMQSLLCSLSQVEEPKKLYTRKKGDVKWSFPQHNFFLAIFWTPFLVKHTVVRETPTFLVNVYLDTSHDSWSSSLPEFDVVVMSASQWFFRPSVYYINNTVVGCNQFAGMEHNCTMLTHINAFRTALGTTLKVIANTPAYKGLTLLRSVSTEHFEHGYWSTGGICNRTQPFVDNGNVTLGWSAETLNSIQVIEFQKVAEMRTRNNSKFKLLDVTRSMFLRPDGHPGPYRTFQPYAELKNFGKHVQNDCLHWCLPGPIDMWNQLLLETIR